MQVCTLNGLNLEIKSWEKDHKVSKELPKSQSHYQIYISIMNNYPESSDEDLNVSIISDISHISQVYKDNPKR